MFVAYRQMLMPCSSNNKTISRPSYTKPHPACVVGEQAVRQVAGQEQGIPDMPLASKCWWNVAF